MTTAEDNFNKKGIDQDLDEEKKCCFCIGLENPKTPKPHFFEKL